MKQKNIKIIISAIIALVILGGIVTIGILGFNKELKYQQGQSIDVYIEQEVDLEKIKEIVNESLGNSKYTINTVEIYKDLVTIKAKEITDDQKSDIVNKLKENYEFSQTAEDTTIKTVPATRIIDMYQKYIIPFVIAEILVLIYMVIRYYKKGILKTIAMTIGFPVIFEMFLLSVIAITRIPLGRFTPILVIIAYIVSIICDVNECEKIKKA